MLIVRTGQHMAIASAPQLPNNNSYQASINIPFLIMTSEGDDALYGY